MRILSASIFAFLACLALAVQVPQDSADKYYFTTPNVPTNITGNVIGDGEPSYSVLRSEDIAWLHEAYAERVGLLRGMPAAATNVTVLIVEYGKWPLSATNRFVKWITKAEKVGESIVTNIVVGWTETVTNSLGGVDSAPVKSVDPKSGIDGVETLPNWEDRLGGYLTISNNAYVEHAFCFEKGDPRYKFRETTNYTFEVRAVDAWSNCVTTIEMAMTNGTTSVHTNSWTVYAPTNVTVAVTNILQHYPYYREDESLTLTDGVVIGYKRALPGKIKGILSNSNFTNHYAFLRDCRRIFRTPNPTTVMPDKWTSYDESRSSPAMPSDGEWNFNGSYQNVSSPYISISAGQGMGESYKLTNKVTYVSNDWGWTKDYDWSLKNCNTYRADGTMTYRVMGREGIPDGETITIKGIRMYAIANASYSESSYAGNGAPDDTPSVYDTNYEWRVVLTMDPPALYSPDGTNVLFDVNWGTAFFEDVWGETPAPAAIPTDNNQWVPDLRYSQPESEIGEDWPATYPEHLPGPESSWSPKYEGATQTHKTFHVGLTHLYLLIDAEPLTSLPSWKGSNQ